MCLCECVSARNWNSNSLSYVIQSDLSWAELRNTHNCLPIAHRDKSNLVINYPLFMCISIYSFWKSFLNCKSFWVINKIPGYRHHPIWNYVKCVILQYIFVARMWMSNVNVCACALVAIVFGLMWIWWQSNTALRHSDDTCVCAVCTVFITVIVPYASALLAGAQPMNDTKEKNEKKKQNYNKIVRTRI